MQHRILTLGSISIALVALGALSTLLLTHRDNTAHTATRPTEVVKPLGMVKVEGGTYMLGTNDPEADDDVRPARSVNLPSFYIDRTEVTNAAFAKFRLTHPFPKDEANLPVTHVTYEEAEAYATWAGKRIPTNDEWEAAARGKSGFRYPWGDTWDPKKVASRRVGKKQRVQPVGSLASGASPCGALDMAGNAWEWVQGFYNGNKDQRILRGGAVGYGERACRSYNRAVEGACVT